MTGWRMPAEWEPHERTWMAWPSAGYTLGEDAGAADEARACWASVANAIARFEPVTVVVDPADVAIARGWLADSVEILEAPLDDAWMRDIGPTFVIGPDGSLAGVDWVFNGWGAQAWATWEKDAQVARAVCRELGVPVVTSPLVNEGGGIHVNGAGTVLLTRTVQLGEGRNAHWTQQQVEEELRRTLGVERFVWLERGLTRDYDEFGTRGHVDIVACFSDETTVLFHDQRDPEHPDHAVSAEVRARARGRARAARRRRARARHPPGRRGLGRLLVHQPLRLQRRRHPVRVRRPGRRAGRGDPARRLPRPRDRARRRPAAVRPRAAASTASRSSSRAAPASHERRDRPAAAHHVDAARRARGRVRLRLAHAPARRRVRGDHPRGRGHDLRGPAGDRRRAGLGRTTSSPGGSRSRCTRRWPPSG